VAAAAALTLVSIGAPYRKQPAGASGWKIVIAISVVCEPIEPEHCTSSQYVESRDPLTWWEQFALHRWSGTFSCANRFVC
jgi:hypothetical protein